MIYVTGDMHGSEEYGRNRLCSDRWPDGRGLSRSDFLIVCGDFGYVWDDGPTDRWWLDWLEEKPWTTLFIDGNHENHRLLAAYPSEEWSGGLIHVVRPHVRHLMRGQVFNLDGTRIFAMGGARSHDIRFRREGVTWWPEEMPDEEEMSVARANLDRAGWSVDYVVTHECPLVLAKDLNFECARPFDGKDPLQAFLQEMDERLTFHTWFFGHYHDDEWRTDGHRLIYHDIVKIDVRREDEDREPL